MEDDKILQQRMYHTRLIAKHGIDSFISQYSGKDYGLATTAAEKTLKAYPEATVVIVQERVLKILRRDQVVCAQQ